VNWKTADDGKGTIMRLLETAGSAATAHLSFPLLNVESAWRCNAAEENQQTLSPSGHSLPVNLKPHEIATLRIVATMSGAGR